MPIQQAPDSIYAGTKISNAEKAQLVAFYKRAFEDIAEALDSHVWSQPSKPRLVELLAVTMAILGALDKKAARWVERNVPSLYRNNARWVDKTLIASGIPKDEIRKAAFGSALHRDTIDALLRNPTSGIAPRLLDASRQFRSSIQEFVAENRRLLRQYKLVSSDAARGIQAGEGASRARNVVFKTIMARGPLPNRGVGIGINPFLDAARSLVDAPFLYIPLASGGQRRMHILDYVHMVAFNTEARVRTAARMSRMSEQGIHLAQITPVPAASDNCVCNLYAGRIVSLDMETERATGYPYIYRLPHMSGPWAGPPFHPYCVHSLEPWSPSFFTEAETAEAEENGDPRTRTFGGRGIPVGALNTDFTGAMRYLRKRGGGAFAIRQNPGVRGTRAIR